MMESLVRKKSHDNFYVENIDAGFASFPVIPC